MLKKIALVLLVAIVALLGYAATRPDTFRVQRSLLIQAPAERIFPLVNDFKAWAQWSPYEHLDPQMKRSYSEITVGQGARYGWDGNDQAGAGSMLIVESAPSSKISIQLDFTKPFASSNTAQFTFEPQDGGTLVTWAMFGPAPYISKLIGIFCDMDQMIGKDFETGLASLAVLAQQQPQ